MLERVYIVRRCSNDDRWYGRGQVQRRRQLADNDNSSDGES